MKEKGRRKAGKRSKNVRKLKADKSVRESGTFKEPDHLHRADAEDLDRSAKKGNCFSRTGSDETSRNS